MEDPRVDLPSCAGFETVGTGMEEDSVVALVPFFQAAADVFFGGTRLQAHVGVGEIVLYLVVLRRKVIGFRLSLLSYELGEGVALMHVMGDGAHVVKKFAEQIPSVFTFHYIGTEQEVPGRLDGFFEQELIPGFGPDITEPLVGPGVWSVGRFRGGRKPALVDAPAVAAKGVQIVGMELEPAPGNHERSWDPTGLQPENAATCVDDFLNLRSGAH